MAKTALSLLQPTGDLSSTGNPPVNAMAGAHAQARVPALAMQNARENDKSDKRKSLHISKKAVRSRSGSDEDDDDDDDEDDDDDDDDEDSDKNYSPSSESTDTDSASPSSTSTSEQRHRRRRSSKHRRSRRKAYYDDEQSFSSLTEDSHSAKKTRHKRQRHSHKRAKDSSRKSATLSANGDGSSSSRGEETHRHKAGHRRRDSEKNANRRRLQDMIEASAEFIENYSPPEHVFKMPDTGNVKVVVSDTISAFVKGSEQALPKIRCYHVTPDMNCVMPEQRVRVRDSEKGYALFSVEYFKKGKVTQDDMERLRGDLSGDFFSYFEKDISALLASGISSGLLHENTEIVPLCDVLDGKVLYEKMLISQKRLTEVQNLQQQFTVEEYNKSVYTRIFLAPAFYCDAADVGDDMLKTVHAATSACDDNREKQVETDP